MACSVVIIWELLDEKIDGFFYVLHGFCVPVLHSVHHAVGHMLLEDHLSEIGKGASYG